MAKKVIHNKCGDPEEIDKKLQNLFDQIKTESEALKKILEALNDRNTNITSTIVLKGKKIKKK